MCIYCCIKQFIVLFFSVTFTMVVVSNLPVIDVEYRCSFIATFIWMHGSPNPAVWSNAVYLSSLCCHFDLISQFHVTALQLHTE